MGLLREYFSQHYPPASKYTEDDVPDLTGKVVLVTGGNTGIGKETARVILAHGAKVYIGCRSPERANAAIEELKKLAGKEDIHFLQLDLADLASIKHTAEEFMRMESKLDVLFNNAGVMATPLEQLTKQGYDMQFGTNVLGHYYLTTLLLPVLRAAASQSPDGTARVVNTSSFGHLLAKKGGVDYKTLKPDDNSTSESNKARKKLGPDVLYYQSKLGNVLLSNELHKHYGKDGVVSTSLHPGTIYSELGRHWPAFQRHAMGVFMKMQPATLGAITQLYAGTAPDAKDLGGKYLIPWARVGAPSADGCNEEAAAKLWTWLGEQVKAFEENHA
ncbi:NAD-binding protein [Schizopora paradoxa]|uniref:NAD-binding protein n=1 Tax=Schizopora paradoxa TaxID=27342 RepID=A0A0H2R6T2_9AGAM|nr:NAD-binding protein [Schizopora paradoxa]